MDGIKKVSQVFLLFLVFLALAACGVRKPIGISLFESSTDTLDWVTSLPDSVYVEPGMDSSQTTIVQNTHDFFPEDVVQTEDSTVVKLDSTSTIIEKPATKVFIDTVYSTLSDSSAFQLYAMLDTILLNQKLLLERYNSKSIASPDNPSSAHTARRNTDTIVIKNEIYVSGGKLSNEGAVSSTPQVAERTSDPYHDTIRYLLNEIQILKQQLAANKSSAPVQTISAQKEEVKNNSAPGIQALPVVIDQRNENYDSLRAQLNEIKRLIKEQQIKIDHLSAERKAASLEKEDVEIEKDAVEIEKDAYNQEFYLTKMYDQRIRDTVLILQQQIDSLEYALIPKVVETYSDSVLTAYYGTGSNIALNEKEVLDMLTQLSSSRSLTSIFLSGYTDKAGDPASNRYLSEQRVKTIEQKLIDIGIAPKVIYSQYFGSDYASESIIESDRRVEIRIRFERQ